MKITEKLQENIWKMKNTGLKRGWKGDGTHKKDTREPFLRSKNTLVNGITLRLAADGDVRSCEWNGVADDDVG